MGLFYNAPEPTLSAKGMPLVKRTINACETLSHLRAHDVISKQQNGFLSRECTESNLLECLNDRTLALNNRKSVIALYVYFAKAFDGVSHYKLCHKLLSYGCKDVTTPVHIFGFIHVKT